MNTQLAPTSDCVTVLFQAGTIAVDDDGYRVVDSVQDWADLPEDAVGSDRFVTCLDLVVAQRHPGRELIDWIIVDPYPVVDQQLAFEVSV